jgi:hypothetical protein
MDKIKSSVAIATITASQRHDIEFLAAIRLRQWMTTADNGFNFVSVVNPPVAEGAMATGI